MLIIIIPSIIHIVASSVMAWYSVMLESQWVIVIPPWATPFIRYAGVIIPRSSSIIRLVRSLSTTLVVSFSFMVLQQFTHSLDLSLIHI